jgi:hypothetical protein
MRALPVGFIVLELILNQDIRRVLKIDQSLSDLFSYVL